MGILATVVTDFGESRQLYFRINNVDASNHGVASVARVRGYISRLAFEAGGAYMKEYEAIEFTPNVTDPLWTQGYAALKAKMEADYAQNQADIAQMTSDVIAAQTAATSAAAALAAYVGDVTSEKSALQAAADSTASILSDKQAQLTTLQGAALPAPAVQDVLESGQATA
ncbi:TPA: hypothetical protein QDB07_001194 [Burkholderia vietnamiensis]|nr:hypothetical protein [Burkholderia vietnamiensis]